MGLRSGTPGTEQRFAAGVEAITSTLGHADRDAPFHSDCAGLLLPDERKSVEPKAPCIHPARVRVAHESLHRFVAWSDC